MNYLDTYARMSNDELLRLSSHWKTLTGPAQAALAVELEKRNLESEFKVEQQIAGERSTPSGGSPSPTERVMFVFFIIGLQCMFLLPRIWPQNMRLGGLYELLLGISDLWLVWAIVWLVLRAKRIQKSK